MEGGTGIKVLWYRELNTTNTALRKTIRPKLASNEMLAPWGNPVKTAGNNGTKSPKHVRQKQHRTGTVLALSSPFVSRDTCGNVVADA